MSTTTNAPTREPLPPGAGPNGWLAFAAVMLFINGVFAAFWGLAAILNDPVVTVGGGTGVTIWDFTAWGWISVILGALMGLTSVGLFLGKSGARWLAVGFVTLHVLAQFGSISAFPLWSMLVIAIDTVILYQLFVRWQID